MKTKAIVIRHGETEWNLLKRWQGQQNSNLTTTGKQQAEAVAQAIQSFPVDYLYCSDLGRTRETAAPITEKTGKTAIPEPRLRERKFGIFEALTKPEMELKDPESYRRYIERNDELFRIPGGEHLREYADRVTEFMMEIVDKHKGKTVVIVTHGGVLDIIYRLSTGMKLTDERCFKLYNASINHFIHEDGKWSIEQWGDISHLEKVVALDEF